MPHVSNASFYVHSQQCTLVLLNKISQEKINTKKTLASLMLKIYRKVCIIHARTIRSSEQMHMSLTGIVSLDNNFLFANLL